MVSIIGFLAGTLTTAANLPQVWKTYRDKSAVGLSFRMLLILSLGLALWNRVWVNDQFAASDRHERYRDRADPVAACNEMEIRPLADEGLDLALGRTSY